MRYLILLPLLCASVITSARDLFVVLYITDAEVVDMYCETNEMNVLPVPVMYQSVVLTRGTVSWHAVGGVPPYTDLRAEQGPGGLVTVTVMDAACNTYTAFGHIGVNRISKMVNCASDAPMQVSATPFPKSMEPLVTTAKNMGGTRTTSTGVRSVSRATNSRTPAPGPSVQRTAVRREGPSRPAPRPTTPAPRTVSRSTPRSK
ncbi:MAG: hypothetical protein ACK46G_08265 [Flavobacteriales bacterium]|jgi:hypothetical protein